MYIMLGLYANNECSIWNILQYIVQQVRYGSNKTAEIESLFHGVFFFFD